MFITFGAAGMLSRQLRDANREQNTYAGFLQRFEYLRRGSDEMSGLTSLYTVPQSSWNDGDRTHEGITFVGVGDALRRRNAGKSASIDRVAFGLTTNVYLRVG